METHVPPFRQSVYEQMACAHSYGLIYIEGQKVPDTLASYRGTEVHRVLAQYVSHCTHNRVPADFQYLDSLISNVGEETASILETCRDSFRVDYDNLFACEVSMGVDDEWNPTYSMDHDDRPVPIDLVWGFDASGKPPMYCGIADTIYLMPGGRLARIADYKSHPRPFDPTTMQGKLYALLLFLHMPDLDEVEFVLRFVRYANVNRPIKFQRSDVPQLKADVERARARQIDLHTYYSRNALPAIAGAHCTYCPALVNFTCPLGKLNPQMALTPEQRLNFRIWYDVQNRANNQAMAQYVDGTGSTIHAVDGNGNNYSFGPVPREKVTFPLFVQDEGGGFETPIVNALSEWAFTNPEDLRPKRKDIRPWLTNLRIGSTELRRYLKAAKREIVDNAIKDLATVNTTVELRISRDAQVDDGQGEEHREYDGAEQIQQ